MCPHPEIRSLCMQALDLLSSQRHAKAPITIPEYVSIRRGQATAAISEMSAGVSNLPPPPGSKSAWEGLSPQLRYELRSWRDTFSAADYLQALRMRTRGMKIFASVFEKCDVLVTPTTGNVGYPIHEGDEISGASAPQSSMEGLLFTGPYNFLGLPAITLPIGYLRGSKDESERGMPVGLQIVAPWWGEDILFGLAREWEKMAEMERPAVFWDVVGDVSSKA